MSSSILNIVNATVDWVTATLDAPSSRAVIFGFPIGGHLFVEVLLFLVIVYLFSQNSYRPPRRPLTEQEKDELCEEWVPEPLIPSITEEKMYEPPVLESAAGPHTIINGKEVVNFASANYLGLIGHEKLLESCTSALEKYGVGSCGPRGFYGTIDVHLNCEARIANFLGTPDSILYSYGLSTMFSAIPAFAKKGDIIVVDEGVHWGIQNGLHLSRSTIKYFKHNDMEDLRKILEELTSNKKSERVKKLRRYIVVEAVYQHHPLSQNRLLILQHTQFNTANGLRAYETFTPGRRWFLKSILLNSGQIAPLDKIVELKEKYKFRVLLDESNSFGVLGKSGRGLTEYCRIPVEKIDIITAAMGHALATEGGFCTGSARVTDHQRLSSSGYVFSASLPPYLASAAITAIDILEENPDLITKLKKNIAVLWKGLSGIRGLSFASSPESPIVFLRIEKADSLKNELQLQLLQNIANSLLKEHSIFVVTSQKSTLDKCRLPLGIRLFVSAGHTESDLLKAAASLKSVAELVLKDHI